MCYDSLNTSCVIVVLCVPKLLFTPIPSIVYCFSLYELPKYSKLTLDGLVFRKHVGEGADLVDMTCESALSIM